MKDTTSPPSNDDLESYRAEFPVRDRYTYLNHASTGPLPRRSARAMVDMAEGQLTGGGMGYRSWLDAYAGLRGAAARLVGASAGEIAITKNTSEGLSFLSNGIDWKPGDIVVGVEDEFPANYFPWARLARCGVKLKWIPLREGRLDLDEIDRACRGARLFAVSFVQYLSGFRLDLEAAGEICRRHGCWFVLDAVQGLGPFPVDVRKCGVHALSASGHKWLLGPEGCAVFYLQQDLFDEVEPVEFGWTNVEGYPLHSHEERIRTDAGRFECGTLNTIGCFGLRSSIELFLEAGVESVSRRVDDLASYVATRAAVKGYRTFASREGGSGSGIVSFRRDDVDAAAEVRRLAEKGISVAARKGWIRAAPHFYNTEEEIDRLFAELP